MAAHICSYLSAAASQCSGQPLLTCGARASTAKQVAVRVSALAVGLAQRMGVQPGDCMCLAALATDHNLEVLLAITATGAIAAPLNWRWAAAEGAYAAGLVAPRLLAADSACLGFAAGVAEATGSVRALLLLGAPSSYSQAQLEAVKAPVVFAESLIATCPTSSLVLRAAPGNAALVVFTSGTTGKPKGVVLSHTALHVQSMAKLLMVGYNRSDVYLHAAPLFHIGGLSSALAMLMAGARHVFLPRFAPSEFLSAVRQHSVSSFIAVPAMVASLVDEVAAGGQGQLQLDNVRTILLGGGGTSPALRASLRALFPRAAVHTAYGMTEACSSMTFLRLWAAPTAAVPGENSQLQDATDRAAPGASADSPRPSSQKGSDGGVLVGAPPPGIELAVYHPPQGESGPGYTDPGVPHSASCAGASRGAAWGRVASEGAGEVVTRGPHVMLGYWEDAEATQATFLPGGWMRTGDLGYIQQGRLWLMGRAKDMIKSGGENVHSWEVERALASHPAVAAVAVVGVSDWRLGEAVAAAVVVREGWEWRGAHCQVLLQQGRAHAAAMAATASAALAANTGSRNGSAGDFGVGSASNDAETAAALNEVAVEGDAARLAEPAQLKLLAAAWAGLGAASAPQGSQNTSSSLVGAMGLLALEDEALGQQHAQCSQYPRRPPMAEQARVQQLAAGLLQLGSLTGIGSEGASIASGSAGGSSGEADVQGSTGARGVDGRALQRHCREFGLAGFKLPRVFLALPAGEVLPANSTGKVLKHLVKGRVEKEVLAAQGEAGPIGLRSKL